MEIWKGGVYAPSEFQILISHSVEESRARAQFNEIYTVFKNSWNFNTLMLLHERKGGVGSDVMILLKFIYKFQGTDSLFALEKVQVEHEGYYHPRFSLTTIEEADEILSWNTPSSNRLTFFSCRTHFFTHTRDDSFHLQSRSVCN